MKGIKCLIRNNSVLLQQWKDEEISFGRMAEELSKSIINYIDNKRCENCKHHRFEVDQEHSEAYHDCDIHGFQFGYDFCCKYWSKK